MTTKVQEIQPVLTTNHPVAQCFDLKATFGRRYRYEWDEAHGAERAEFRKVEAPWLTIMPCKFGKIVPWGGREVAAYCNAGSVKRHELERLPCVKTAQGGGACAEVIVTFDAADLDQVADVLKARRPRVYSTEEQARRTAQLRRVRAARKTAKSAAYKWTSRGLGAIPAPRVRVNHGSTAIVRNSTPRSRAVSGASGAARPGG